MKKIITKLVLYSILSIFISTTYLQTTTYASRPQTQAEIDAANEKANAAAKAKREAGDRLTKALKDAQDAPCIEELNAEGTGPGADAAYVITIIEEPMDFGQAPEPKAAAKADFKTRICYRNYIRQGSNQVSVFSKICSEYGKEAAATLDSSDPNAIYFSCQRVQVVLSKGGTTMIENYISMLYKWAASIVGIIAVLVIIISGMQISLGGGETSAIDEAKKRIIQSLAGIAILFLSGIILYTINPTFLVK